MGSKAIGEKAFNYVYKAGNHVSTLRKNITPASWDISRIYGLQYPAFSLYARISSLILVAPTQAFRFVEKTERRALY